MEMQCSCRRGGLGWGGVGLRVTRHFHIYCSYPTGLHWQLDTSQVARASLLRWSPRGRGVAERGGARRGGRCRAASMEPLQCRGRPPAQRACIRVACAAPLAATALPVPRAALHWTGPGRTAPSVAVGVAVGLAADVVVGVAAGGGCGGGLPRPCSVHCHGSIATNNATSSLLKWGLGQNIL